jgi:hypothetical protein
MILAQTLRSLKINISTSTTRLGVVKDISSVWSTDKEMLLARKTTDAHAQYFAVTDGSLLLILKAFAQYPRSIHATRNAWRFQSMFSSRTWRLSNQSASPIPPYTQHPPAPRQIRPFSPVGSYIISEMKSYESPNFSVHNRTGCTVDNFYLCMIYLTTLPIYQTAVAQWLRCCATNRKVAGSILAGVIGIFHWHKILPIALWPWGRLSL